MSIERRYILTVIVGISFLAFGSVDSAYAVDFVLSDAASCIGLPGGGEVWAGTTCTKSGNLNLSAGDTLTISPGITLTFTGNFDLRNDGVITNNGIINFVSGGDINNRKFGDFTNSGIIMLDSTVGNTGRLLNQDNAIFTNTISGSIILDGSGGANNNRAQLRNQESASFTNAGTITMDGNSKNSAQLRNQGTTASFTNSGTITITGVADNSGRLRNQGTAGFTNSGTITITGVAEQAGWLLNQGTSTFSNSGTITIMGTSNNSGQFRNLGSASITNSGTITITGDTGDSGLVINLSVIINSGSFTTNNNFNNKNANSAITNSGSIQITLVLDNTGGFIFNDCGEITFGSISGNPIQETPICEFGKSNAYEDATIGKSHGGKQVVENGICIDIRCWTVTAHYHQDFDLVKMLSDSTHTISTTVFCQHGVSKCNYVAFGVSPYGTNINDSVWKIILQKDHLDNWTMKVIDPDRYLGEVTSTTQIVNDNRYLSASATIEFKKPTPGMILNIEVRDSGGGYRDFKFNDGITIADAYAYPSIETSYEAPLEIAPICLNENPNKRYTCAFNLVREWTIKNAEAALKQITK